MSPEDIMWEKKKIFGLVSLYSERNNVVHSGVRDMEAQDLYDHLKKLQEMINENKVMFEEEDMKVIIEEVIEETLNEHFSWEENGDVVYQGNNPRIIVDRVATTAANENDEEKVEGLEQQDQS